MTLTCSSRSPPVTHRCPTISFPCPELITSTNMLKTHLSRRDPLRSCIEIWQSNILHFFFQKISLLSYYTPIVVAYNPFKRISEKFRKNVKKFWRNFEKNIRTIGKIESMQKFNWRSLVRLQFDEKSFEKYRNKDNPRISNY